MLCSSNTLFKQWIKILANSKLSCCNTTVNLSITPLKDFSISIERFSPKIYIKSLACLYVCMYVRMRVSILSWRGLANKMVSWRLKAEGRRLSWRRKAESWKQQSESWRLKDKRWMLKAEGWRIEAECWKIIK